MISLLLLFANAPAALPMPAFLAGCWVEEKADSWTEECWTGPRGGLMIGSGRTGAGDTVRHWEWLRVERDGDGNPTLYASPKGAAPVAFKVVKADANEFEWTNLANDYPQRVRYVRTATGLEAEISMADGSDPVRWSYRAMGTPTE